MSWNPNDCLMCGQPLRGKRYDARFCGANCRKRWSRRKGAVKEAAAKAMSELQELRYFGKQYADLRPEVIAQLRYLRQEVDYILLMFDPQKQHEMAVKNDLLIGIQNRRNLQGG